MKIVVVGSGLIGVCTAYFLRRHGHEVTVVDRQEGPGRETSFANGALLTPSMSDPWNTPGCWRVLLGSLLRSDAPLQLRLGALPTLAGWGVDFLRNSNAQRFERSRRTNFHLARYSLDVMQSLQKDANVEYGLSERGALRVFRDPAAMAGAVADAARMEPSGMKFRRLSPAETVEMEPALAPIAEQLAGAVHYLTDATGDAHRFCVALADHARDLGVEFRFNTEISSLQVRSGAVTALSSAREHFTADRYVIAGGSYSTMLLEPLGIQLPVRPAKGYSVTFELPSSEQSLRIPVVDDVLHAVVVPLEGAIRVAGTAEFAAYDLTLRRQRIENLLKLLGQILPQSRFDPAAAKPWCGLRPMSVDGVPIIGPTALPNLFLNTGHGHLGWTMAAGSGRLLADMITGQAPAIDSAPYSFARFASARRMQVEA